MQINKPVAIILFAIIIGILVFLFVIPKYQEYRQLQLQILQKEAEFSGQSLYYAKVADVLAGLQARQQTLDVIASALPANFSLAPLVNFLQQKGSESGVTVQSIVFSKTSPLALDQVPQTSIPGQVKDIPFTLSASGSYQGLKTFLASMDNSARIFEMDTVVLTPASGTTLKNKLSQYVLKLELRTHSY